MKKPTDLLTVVEAAEEKGIHHNAIYLAVKDGRIKAHRSQRPILIMRRELDRWTPVGHRPKKKEE